MSDLTIIMLTPNKVPESWAKFHKKMLLEAAGDSQIITISAEPLDWGINLIQTEYGLTNVYKQMLRGAKLATTPYIAIADDDTLYSSEHFQYRPPMDKFAYNFSRWHLFTWGDPFYFYKPRPGNGLLVASRELVINALESRFQPDKPMSIAYMNELGSRKNIIEYDKAGYVAFYTYDPVVSFYHEFSVDPLCKQHRKKAWPVRAFDIPKWGKAKELRKHFI